MGEVLFETILGDRIEEMRDLCCELMAHQKSLATISPGSFDKMNFDTRMKRSFETAEDSQIVAAKDGPLAVGYVFSTIENAVPAVSLPDWAPPGSERTLGFYPVWLKLPCKIGCLNNLYLRGSHRGMSLGDRLFDASIGWLESFSDVGVTFVYISNGNTRAMDFYLSRGFTYSHDVFDGFIQAAFRFKDDSWRAVYGSPAPR